MFETGDILEVVVNSKNSETHPPIKIGQKFIANGFRECKCGKIGVDIGLTLTGSANLLCKVCRVPSHGTVAYYSISHFRKLPPPYKLVEVNSEILKQARKLILQ